ncbi:hypothetical protein GCM10025869_16270 [Homoserinibacter gongjuensis]|uniref:ABC transporter domain-containing protein n=1 Tax=Homoserinibacter gongjuensis TaxID=1162968 RepID=A0ABQ6JUN2_9MICO|nr:ATP-binding cassette domain-containing protein [Homoserinibacter gongjuensis]GMA91098.1 hypothetical protein GCM10025869_16270 [Homoserinibacter gongjuensis]
MAIIYGLTTPDAGTIELDGAPIALGSPKEALAHGIGFVQQHFSLIPTLTVAENMVLSLSNSGEKISLGQGPSACAPSRSATDSACRRTRSWARSASACSSVPSC